MIFSVLSYIDLSKVMEIDDYISAIWANKYFETGEFEITVRTTLERVKKLIRNNFIVLNGTDEIAIIDIVQYSKDEDNGATMTIKGGFAQSLLQRRIIWNKTLLTGSIDFCVQNLLRDNAVNPADKDRYLATDGDKKQIISDYIVLPKDFDSLVQLQLSTNIQITRQGSGNDYGLYTTRYQIGRSYATLTAKAKNYELRIKGSTEEVEIFENPLANGVKTTLTIGEGGGRAAGKAAKFAIRSLFTEAGATDFATRANVAQGSTGAVVTIDVGGSSFADQTPFSNRVIGLSKEDYDNGAFGFTLNGGKLYWRMFWPQAMIDYAYLHADHPVLWKEYCYKLYFGYVSNSDYNRITSTDFFVANNKEYVEKEVEIYNSTDGAYVDFKTFAERLEPLASIYPYNRNVNTSLALIYNTKSLNTRNYIALGNIPNSTDKIELQMFGDNLLEKSQELLTLYALGLKARYDEQTKTIFLDIYEGEDRSGNIVFSEDLDNIVSYDIGFSASKPNVALVYSKQDSKEYFETAGAGNGINRTELYLNRTDQAGYVGADYTLQLINDGTLSLQKATIAIENEIDADSYVYRSQFRLGDIVAVKIKDFDISFKTRVLEVREFNDQTGYSIDVVLGE